jgi:Acyl-CoA dehydrogenase, C-terminal domain
MRTPLAKLVASEAATWIAERALHLQDAQGFMLDRPAQRYYRDCKVIEWGEGVNELQREMILRLLPPATGLERKQGKGTQHDRQRKDRPRIHRRLVAARRG